MTPSAEFGNKIKRCAVCKIDFKGRFVFVDEAVERLFGYSSEELFGKSFLDFIESEQQPLLSRVLYQRNHFETFFESIRLNLVDRSNTPIPATVVVSLNFIAGNPVNFQIIIDVDAPVQGSVVDSGHDVSYQQMVSELLSVPPENYYDAALTLLHRHAGTKRCILYMQSDNQLEPIRFAEDRVYELTDLRSYEPILWSVISAGEEYFFLEPAAVQRAIEKTQSAPNDFITRFELAQGQPCMMRVAFGEDADPSTVQSTVAHIRQAIQLARRLAPGKLDQPSSVQPDIAASTVLDILAHSSVHCCLTGADGSVLLIDRSLVNSLKAKAPIERYRDLFVALAEFNSPEAMQRMVDTIYISQDAGRDLRFDEVVNIAGGGRARLVIARETRSPHDESACFVLTPLSRQDSEKFDGSIDNQSLRLIVQELQSTLNAGASIAERLAHEYYDELGRDGNYYLVSLGEKHRKLMAMMTSLLTSLQLVDEDEAAEILDLNLVLANLSSELRSSYPGLNFNLIYTDLPKVITRPRKLAMAIRHVLVNSMKYGHPNGVEVTVKAGTQSETCSVSIADNGPGISPRFVSHVQEFYYRAPDPHTQGVDGVGCGLAIVRQIMKSLGGRMTLTAEPDKGTVVTLVFPVVSAE
ncbi:MAG: PAS domain-containing sensor histidine kinase [Candidatus Zixiibacteriota bacterium]